MDDHNLIHYLNGQGDPESRKIVEEWLQADPAHDAHFQKIRRIWELGREQAEAPDIDQAWLKVREAIAVDKGQRYFLKTGLRVAAVIAVLLAGFWIWLQLRPVPMVTASHGSGAEPVKVELPDGSVAWLNRNTQLRYPKTFEGDERLVELEGEAFFEIKRDTSLPFRIQTQATNTEVLGTSFNLMAHGDSSWSRIQVQSGKVAFSARNDQQTFWVLEKDQGAMIDKVTQRGHIMEHPDPNFLAWKTRVFTFRDTRLEDAVILLGAVFDLVIKLENGDLRDCRLNATYLEESPEEILNSVATLFQLKTARSGNVITLSGGQTC